MAVWYDYIWQQQYRLCLACLLLMYSNHKQVFHIVRVPCVAFVCQQHVQDGLFIWCMGQSYWRRAAVGHYHNRTWTQSHCSRGTAETYNVNVLHYIITHYVKKVYSNFCKELHPVWLQLHVYWLNYSFRYTTTTPQPFYGPFSGTTRVSRCQKITSRLYGARED